MPQPQVMMPKVPSLNVPQKSARISSNMAKFHQQQMELSAKLAAEQEQREQQEREREEKQQEALEEHRLMMENHQAMLANHRLEMDAKQHDNEKHTQEIFRDQQMAMQKQQEEQNQRLQEQQAIQREQELAQMELDKFNMNVNSRLAKPVSRMMAEGAGRMIMDDGKLSEEQLERDAAIRQRDQERLQREKEQREREKQTNEEQLQKLAQHQQELEDRLLEQANKLEEQRLQREQAEKERQEKLLSDLEDQRMAMENHQMELENHRIEMDAALLDRDQLVQSQFNQQQEAIAQKVRDQEERLREQEAAQREAEAAQRDLDMSGEFETNGRILNTQVPIVDLSLSCAESACLNAGVCQASENGTMVCMCSKPWTGVKCERVWQNPCTEENLRASLVLQYPDPWNPNNYILCTDINIYNTLSCGAGTVFNELYGHCMHKGGRALICPLNYCKNDAECTVEGNDQFTCTCKLGFTGERCEENINECLSAGGNEACAGGLCVDQLDGFYCKCPGGRVGLNCQETIMNPCTISSIEAGRDFFVMPEETGRTFLQCTSENNFVFSRCGEGLFWHQEHKSCSHERPMLKSGKCLEYPCNNGGECKNLNDTEFECTCKLGFTGEFCETMIDSCASNPCQNGGRCLSFAGGYTCACPDKIIDECCCHGLKNPCPEKSQIVPGVNNYFPHLYVNRYIHCDFDGRAFSRKCSDGLKWSQRSLSCLPDTFLSDIASVKVKTLDVSETTTVQTTTFQTTTPVENTNEMKLAESDINAEIREIEAKEKMLEARRQELMNRVSVKALRFTQPRFSYRRFQ